MRCLLSPPFISEKFVPLLSFFRWLQSVVTCALAQIIAMPLLRVGSLWCCSAFFPAFVCTLVVVASFSLFWTCPLVVPFVGEHVLGDVSDLHDCLRQRIFETIAQRLVCVCVCVYFPWLAFDRRTPIGKTSARSSRFSCGTPCSFLQETQRTSIAAPF